MAPRIGQQTVTIVRRERLQPGGLQPTGVRDEVAGCFVEPHGGADGEQQQAGQHVRQFRIYGPPNLGSARSVDLLEIDGRYVGRSSPVTLEPSGEPDIWPDFRGRVDHVERDAVYVVAPAAGIVVVRVVRDTDGDPVGDPVEHLINDCVVHYGGSEEAAVNTPTEVTTEAIAYVRDPAADVRATDRIRLLSDPTPAPDATLKTRAPWRVVGQPQPWQAVRGTDEVGLVVRLERLTG